MLFCAGLIMSCNEEPIGTSFAEDNYQPTGALVTTSNTSGCFLVDPSISTVEFDVDSKGEPVSSVEILATYGDGDEISLGTVTDLPGSASVDMQDIVDAAGITDPAAGDAISLAFRASTSTGTYRSSNTMNFNVGCVSNLAGTHTFVSTMLVAANSQTACPSDPVSGEVTFTDLGCGVYACSDMGFGQYESTCWNDSAASDGAASFDDVCDELTVYGADQYGLVYDWTIVSVEGPELTIQWTNDYADSGTAVITREGGEDWPTLN